MRVIRRLYHVTSDDFVAAPYRDLPTVIEELLAAGYDYHEARSLALKLATGGPNTRALLAQLKEDRDRIQGAVADELGKHPVGTYLIHYLNWEFYPRRELVGGLAPGRLEVYLTILVE